MCTGIFVSTSFRLTTQSTVAANGIASVGSVNNADHYLIGGRKLYISNKIVLKKAV